MNGWRLTAGTRWLDQNTLVGGSPYRAMILTPEGTHAVQMFLSKGKNIEFTPDQMNLLDRLERAGLMIPQPSELISALNVTVIIPALSAPEAVQRTLTMLPPEIGVIVVDDGSPSPLPEALTPQPNLKILRNEYSLGPAAARNAGAAIATTDWLLFLDADVEPNAEIFSQLLGFTTRPGVVAVAPRIQSRPGSNLAAWFESFSALDLGPLPAFVGQGRPISYVPSACLIVKATVFRKIKGFQVDMHVGEDVDLIWRLEEHGQILYEPSIVVIHEPRTRILDALNRRRFYGTGAASLSLRHPGKIRHADVSMWSLAPWLMGVIISPLLGCIISIAIIINSPRCFPSLHPQQARKLAASGQITAVVGLGRWLIRPLLPATLALAIFIPKFRTGLALATLIGSTEVVRRSYRQSTTGTLGHRVVQVSGTIVASILDDIAYSLGVWQGALKNKISDPLLLNVRDFPKR